MGSAQRLRLKARIFTPGFFAGPSLVSKAIGEALVDREEQQDLAADANHTANDPQQASEGGSFA